MANSPANAWRPIRSTSLSSSVRLPMAPNSTVAPKKTTSVQSSVLRSTNGDDTRGVRSGGERPTGAGRAAGRAGDRVLGDPGAAGGGVADDGVVLPVRVRRAGAGSAGVAGAASPRAAAAARPSARVHRRRDLRGRPDLLELLDRGCRRGARDGARQRAGGAGGGARVGGAGRATGVANTAVDPDRADG